MKTPFEIAQECANTIKNVALDDNELVLLVERAIKQGSREGEHFHPLMDSDVLNQPGSRLANYRVGDRRSRTSYVAQRLLQVALLTYLKHHRGADVIGWDALGDELHAAICEAVGDDEFCKWSDTTSKA